MLFSLLDDISTYKLFDLLSEHSKLLPIHLNYSREMESSLIGHLLMIPPILFGKSAL